MRWNPALFSILGFLFVGPQVPLPVLIKPVQADELILFVCRRVVAPGVPFVSYNLSLLDELLSMIECFLI